MHAIDLIKRLHQHRAWVNAQLRKAANHLTVEQLRLPLPIGQGSIWKSLLHLYAAEFVWLAALQGNETPVIRGDLPDALPGNQLGAGGFETLAQLVNEWEQLEQRWSEYLSSLQIESLEELVYKKSTSSGFGRRFGTKRSDVLLHVCTHAQYTTAQVNNMLRQVGYTSIIDVMLISLARQELTHQP